MRLGTMIIGAMIATSPCLAMDLPRYDPEKTCEAQASTGAGRSRAQYQSCIKMQQEGYDAVKKAWKELEEPVQRHCDEQARFVSQAGSYAQLKFCADTEVEAAKKAGDTKFKF